MEESAFHRMLREKGSLVVAEGYVMELERRGYLQAGSFVPEVVLDNPDVVRALHQEFVHAGSDIVVAVTYYGNRDKLRVTGREDKVEELNRQALSIAKEVARSTGTLLAGNICNSCVYQRDNDEAKQKVECLFKEQIEWAVEAGVDCILAETYSELGEALLALQCIKKYGKGVPAVVNLIPGPSDMTFDGVKYPEACRQLEEAGADVVGLNCARGPATMLPLIKEVKKACKGPIACIPVPIRTSPESPTSHSLKDPVTGKMAFPYDLPAHACGRTEVKAFAEACKDIGIEFVGLCCGNSSHYTRIVAEAYGRTPPGSKYSMDMSKSYIFSSKTDSKQSHTQDLFKWKTGF